MKGPGLSYTCCAVQSYLPYRLIHSFIDGNLHDSTMMQRTARLEYSSATALYTTVTLTETLTGTALETAIDCTTSFFRMVLYCIHTVHYTALYCTATVLPAEIGGFPCVLSL